METNMNSVQQKAGKGKRTPTEAELVAKLAAAVGVLRAAERDAVAAIAKGWSVPYEEIAQFKENVEDRVRKALKAVKAAQKKLDENRRRA
jgi:hypothetical protein